MLLLVGAALDPSDSTRAQAHVARAVMAGVVVWSAGWVAFGERLVAASPAFRGYLELLNRFVQVEADDATLQPLAAGNLAVGLAMVGYELWVASTLP